MMMMMMMMMMMATTAETTIEEVGRGVPAEQAEHDAQEDRFCGTDLAAFRLGKQPHARRVRHPEQHSQTSMPSACRRFRHCSRPSRPRKTRAPGGLLPGCFDAVNPPRPSAQTPLGRP